MIFSKKRIDLQLSGCLDNNGMCKIGTLKKTLHICRMRQLQLLWLIQVYPPEKSCTELPLSDA